VAFGADGRPAVRFVLTMVTDRRRLPSGALAARAGEMARAGVDAVQVREKDLSDRALRELAGEVRASLAGTPTRLLVNGRPDVALAAGADGVQLPEEGLPVRDVKRAFPTLAVGASCHSVEAARRAAGEGADFVLLGPIFPPSGKEARALGLEAVRAAVAAVAVPVHAIGGLTPRRAAEVLAAGARGAAGIAAFLEGSADAIMSAFREADRGPRGQR
jgi:thiamine-phosphate pyrophosphorylase